MLGQRTLTALGAKQQILPEGATLPGMPAEINLLRSKTRFSPEISALIGQLRRISLVVIFAVLMVGLTVGAIFFYLQLSLTSLLNQKNQLLAEINANARKEALYREIKAELGIAARVMGSQKSWNAPAQSVLALTAPPTLSSFSVDDKSQITLNISTANVESAAGIVGSVVSLVGQNKAKNPVLEDFSLDKKGGVRMLISFMPILP